jgi:hypothetical protein
MMRIHELIQRKKIIQSLNENYSAMQQLEMQQQQTNLQKMDPPQKRSVRILPQAPNENQAFGCPFACSSSSPLSSPITTFDLQSKREAREGTVNL